MSFKRISRNAVALAALVFVAAPAFASNVMFLNDTALSKMNDEDLEIARAAARDALDNAADGESRRWGNAQTGASGVITPISTYEQDGTACRRTEFFNEAQGVQGRSVFEFCRQADGTWRIPAPSPTGGTAAK